MQARLTGLTPFPPHQPPFERLRSSNRGRGDAVLARRTTLAAVDVLCLSIWLGCGQDLGVLLNEATAHVGSPIHSRSGRGISDPDGSMASSLLHCFNTIWRHLSDVLVQRQCMEMRSSHLRFSQAWTLRRGACNSTACLTMAASQKYIQNSSGSCGTCSYAVD